MRSRTGGYHSPVHKALVAYLEAHGGSAPYEELVVALIAKVPPGPARRTYLRTHPNRHHNGDIEDEIASGARTILKKAVFDSQRFALTTYPDGHQVVQLLEPIV